MANMSEAKIRYLWRTKYPWILVTYILAFGLMRGIVTGAPQQDALNLLMIFAFASYIFLFVFYIFGVKPVELEYHWRKK